MSSDNQNGIKFPLPTLDHFAAGTIAGVAGLISGYPMDTVKVRMQTELVTRRSAIRLFLDTVQKEGAFALYKGMLSPMLGEGFIQSILFGSYGFMQSVLRKPSVDGVATPLSLLDTSIAGGVSGIAVSIASCPVELLKNKLQAQGAAVGSSKGPVYTGTFDCLFKVLKSEGILGLWYGLNITFIREIPAYAAYFWTYEYLRRTFAKWTNIDNVSQIPVGYQLTAGGIAGITCWLSSYPQIL
eukprot:TRINITY_DN4310_c0_g2_i5.p1 TRINITY_DN4310_c0_g2~~TRINITY_DN4310_c0_g2_i5.p1  ORF type:complete len:241 (-),score=29.81 TRINITY_DN4310_c0_g2_i5:275-997(-)